jgi:hypothetical protein
LLGSLFSYPILVSYSSPCISNFFLSSLYGFLSPTMFLAFLLHLVECESLALATLIFPLLHGSIVGWGIMLQAGRSWVWFPMRSLDFTVNLILPTALWPWSRLNL